MYSFIIQCTLHSGCSVEVKCGIEDMTDKRSKPFLLRSLSLQATSPTMYMSQNFRKIRWSDLSVLNGVLLLM